MTGFTHNPDYRLLLEVLRTARKEQGISQVELATRLGNTQTFISKCERGERRIDLVEFVEMAEALDVEPQKLLNEYLAKRAGHVPAGRKSAKSRRA